MSTSLLYHAFGTCDYQHMKSEFVEGEVVFTLERRTETLCCTACGTSKVTLQGSVVRAFRTLPIGSRPVTLEAHIPRLGCQEYGVVRQAGIGFAEPRRTYTKVFVENQEAELFLE